MSSFDFEDYRVAINSSGDRLVVGKDNNYHLMFRKSDGLTLKWGLTEDDDPTHCPYGNEIADIEITTKCRGIRGSDGIRRVCSFCYKRNTPVGDNMSFETFKRVFDNLNASKTMTQIAFGVDAECNSNPDTFKIFQYAKDNGVTPNVTVADIDLDVCQKLVDTCGAVAVSAYASNKSCCYDTVRMLLDECRLRGKSMAVNIHVLVSAETYDFLFELLDDVKNDPRLAGLNAVVFLSLKQKGRGEDFTVVSDSQYKTLVDELFSRDIRFGFDSCSANSFMLAIKDRPDYLKLYQMVEPCEAFCFSAYVNVFGELFPCSFIEGESGWESGIDLTQNFDFVKDVWNGDARVLSWREDALSKISCDGCNSCPVFKIR